MVSGNLSKLRIFTWHIHGSYLYYLSHCPCNFYIPKDSNNKDGYIGKTSNFPWREKVHEILKTEVKTQDFDIILFQSKKNYLKDQYDILSPHQRMLPKIFLEHDPPQKHPTNTKHVVDDPNVVIVHVTDFNNLMWDNNLSPTVVIKHGVKIPTNVRYNGHLQKGVVVINNIVKRGRRLGLDIFEKVRKQIPLDIVGMNSELVGGLGEVPFIKLPQFISHYRFFFNPIRYTSLGLSVLEAMAAGMPVVGLATTEVPLVLENNVTGFTHTNTDFLIEKMYQLLNNPTLARKLSGNAKRFANTHYNIVKFTQNWLNLFTSITKKTSRTVRPLSNSLAVSV
ncbi:MAG: glycosyltransferase [Patescibacteria group bacterium]|jgi:glycosyltransferase involved in cell wall biosynthesis